MVDMTVVVVFLLEGSLAEKRHSEEIAARRQLGPGSRLARLMPKLPLERSQKDFPETREMCYETDALEGPTAQNKEPGFLRGHPVLKPVLHLRKFAEMVKVRPPLHPKFLKYWNCQKLAVSCRLPGTAPQSETDLIQTPPRTGPGV